MSQARKTFADEFNIQGLVVATLTIFTRSAFRIAELSQGDSGYLANNEVLFMVRSELSPYCSRFAYYHRYSKAP